MKKAIHNITGLRRARQELKLKKQHLEVAISNDIENIKQALHPSEIIQSIITDVKTNESLAAKVKTSTFSVFTDFIINKVLMRNSSFIKRALVSYLVENLGYKIIVTNQDSIIQGISLLTHKFFSREKSNGHYDRSTAAELS